MRCWIVHENLPFCSLLESPGDSKKVVISLEENALLVYVLLRSDKTFDDGVARTVDVAVDKQVARGTAECAVGQRQCVFYRPAASAYLARVLFSHSREACPLDLTFEGQTLVD